MTSNWTAAKVLKQKIWFVFLFSILTSRLFVYLLKCLMLINRYDVVSHGVVMELPTLLLVHISYPSIFDKTCIHKKSISLLYSQEFMVSLYMFYMALVLLDHIWVFILFGWFLVWSTVWWMVDQEKKPFLFGTLFRKNFLKFISEITSRKYFFWICCCDSRYKIFPVFFCWNLPILALL